MLASAGKVVAVIDGDLQHDERLLPRMLAEIEGGADLVIASRYTGAGNATGGFSKIRQRWSWLATRLTNRLLKTKVSDPMSGFFMIRRDAIEDIAPKLSTGGFKLLLDILASSPPALKISELPYMFRPRRLGASKLDGSSARTLPDSCSPSSPAIAFRRVSFCSLSSARPASLCTLPYCGASSCCPVFPSISRSFWQRW